MVGSWLRKGSRWTQWHSHWSSQGALWTDEHRQRCRRTCPRRRRQPSWSGPSTVYPPPVERPCSGTTGRGRGWGRTQTPTQNTRLQVRLSPPTLLVCVVPPIVTFGTHLPYHPLRPGRPRRHPLVLSSGPGNPPGYDFCLRAPRPPRYLSAPVVVCTFPEAPVHTPTAQGRDSTGRRPGQSTGGWGPSTYRKLPDIRLVEETRGTPTQGVVHSSVPGNSWDWSRTHPGPDPCSMSDPRTPVSPTSHFIAARTDPHPGPFGVPPQLRRGCPGTVESLLQTALYTHVDTLTLSHVYVRTQTRKDTHLHVDIHTHTYGHIHTTIHKSTHTSRHTHR